MRFYYWYLPYLVVLLSATFFPIWIFPGPSYVYSLLSILGMFFQFFSGKIPKKNFERFESSSARYLWIICLVFFSFALLFPIQNRSWGDGLLLLETNLLETSLFGFQFTLDEIGETVSHSLVLKALPSFAWEKDPIYSYTFLAYLALIGFIFFWLKDWLHGANDRFYPTILLFGSGGMFLFFGYSENYTLTTFIHFLFYIFITKNYQTKLSTTKYLLIATILLSIAILFHLVSGYLVLVLFYLWLTKVPKRDKVKVFLFCSFVGLSILLPVFLYFLFVHTPSIDTQSTHLIHPPFYPVRRLISLNHLKEIFLVALFNAGVAFVYILANAKEIFSLKSLKEEQKILLVAISAFAIHGFIHNPQLGFPADWDLMGFYWLPIVLFVANFWSEDRTIGRRWFPLLIFSFLLFITRAYHLHKPDPKQDLVWLITKESIQEFIKKEKIFITSLPKNKQKFYAKGAFLFYKGENLLDSFCDKEGFITLQNKMKSLSIEWKEGFQNTSFENRNNLKEFLQKATLTNMEFIKAVEANKICHP